MGQGACCVSLPTQQWHATPCCRLGEERLGRPVSQASGPQERYAERPAKLCPLSGNAAYGGSHVDWPGHSVCQPLPLGKLDFGGPSGCETVRQRLGSFAT